MKYKNGFVVTMQYNEEDLLPIWVKHYSKYFDLQQMYVIDHGSTDNYVPDGVNRIYVPRTTGFNEWARRDSIKFIVSSLRKFYDFGVYCDSDELIVLDGFDPATMFKCPVIYVLGFDLFNVLLNGERRIFGMLNAVECKPLIFNCLAPDWTVGFHGCRIDKFAMPSILMGHTKYFNPEVFNKNIVLRKQVYDSLPDRHKENGVASHWNETDALEKAHKRLELAIQSGFFRKKVSNYNPKWGNVNNGQMFMASADPITLDLTEKFPDLLAWGNPPTS